MPVKTILNRLYNFPSFVYEEIVLPAAVEQLVLKVDVRPRANTRAICSGCGRRCSGYDTRPPRRFEFFPLWAIPIVSIYAMRRVDCSDCGIRVERVPWAQGKSPLTRAYALFLAQSPKLERRGKAIRTS